MGAPNPDLVWELMTAHQRTAALRAGVELGVFDALGEGPAAASELAARAGVAERGMRILCDSLTIYGLLERNGGKYAHTPTSAVFLDSKSPASMAPTLPFLMSPKILRASSLMTETIRRGRTALDEPLAGEEVGEWVTFARTMQPILRNASEFLADVVVRDVAPTKVLDVAASHGLFGFAVARRAPGCEIVALDFPSVLEVTKEHAAAEGIAISTIAGSAFTADLGTGYDAVLVTNLYHHFSVEDCVTLMKRFREALKPGGRMLTLEFVPDEDRLTPPAPAQFALMMLTNTPSGDAYTFRDYNGMLDAAGFGAREMMDVPQSAQRLIVAARE